MNVYDNRVSVSEAINPNMLPNADFNFYAGGKTSSSDAVWWPIPGWRCWRNPTNFTTTVERELPTDLPPTIGWGFAAKVTVPNTANAFSAFGLAFPEPWTYTGQWYSISFWAKTNKSCSAANLYYIQGQGATSHDKSWKSGINLIGDNAWHYYQTSIYVDDLPPRAIGGNHKFDACFILELALLGQGQTVTFFHPKMEVGQFPTPWCMTDKALSQRLIEEQLFLIDQSIYLGTFNMNGITSWISSAGYHFSRPFLLPTRLWTSPFRKSMRIKGGATDYTAYFQFDAVTDRGFNIRRNGANFPANGTPDLWIEHLVVDSRL